MKKYLKSISLCLILVSFSCSDDESCAYDTDKQIPCVPGSTLLDDFENYTIGTAGNWQQQFLSFMEVVTKSGSKKLYFRDDSGGSNAYNTLDFPKDLTQAGCEFTYDVEYDAGFANAPSTTNSLSIYKGNFSTLTFTSRAVFILKAPNLIVSGAAAKTIIVPLTLATGTTLPSNAYGDWVLIGGSPTPTPADIAAFNALIVNIDGVSFPIDSGSNPVEQWWYDNFKFTQCCP